MKERSTKKQQELLQFIDNFIKGNGYGPSYREIMRGLGYKSVSTVAVHVDGLITKGYLRKRDHSARSIEIVSMQQDAPSPHKAEPVKEHEWLRSEIARFIKEEADEDVIDTLLAAANVLGVDVTEVEDLRVKSRNTAS